MELRLEEGNDFEDPSWHLVCIEFSSWMGWDNLAANCGIHLTEMLGEPYDVRVDDGDGKIIKTWEVTEEHREG